MEILLANNIDPDQTSHYVASDLGLHCLPMALLRVSMLEWIKSSLEHRSDNRTAKKCRVGVV